MAQRECATRDGHSSGTPVARRLKQPTRTAGSGHRSRNRLRDLAPSLFGLAPGGVCHAADVAADAVRSYRTFSPLPQLIRNAPRRFVFCGTVPETGSPLARRQVPPDVIRHRTSMEPGLSSPATFRSLPERPSGRLTPSGWGRSRPPSRVCTTIQLIKGYRFAHNEAPSDRRFMSTSSFIEKHGLYGDGQKRQAQEIKLRLEKNDIHFVRMAWADPHGASRAKAVAAPDFIAALSKGYNINVATTTLDSANARTFSSFTRGGGMGLAEMTGSPNLTIVPDPSTFRLLPWAPGVGWILCDEYFNSGVPFHFSPRHLLRRQLRRLADKGMGYVVGLEVEWYLFRVAEDQLGDEHIGAPGVRGLPVRTCPPEPGYSYHSESNMDLMQPVLSALADAFEGLALPLRSIENEWGPGQVECTFAAGDALTTADNLLLFRTATRQICRRLGHFATFMCRPGLKGCYSSGWHLHQSVIDKASGKNLFMPSGEGAVLSPLGLHF